MINFKEYYQLIVEGGNVFKNHPTVRILLNDINPTVSFISVILGMDLSKNLLGSTGKRESSGDLDIAIPVSKMSKEQIVDKLTKWCEDRNLNPKDYIAKSGISVHFRAPIIGRDGEFVQADLMLVDDLRYAKFILANDEQAPFNGADRAVVLSNLAKAVNMSISSKGLKDRETGQIIEDKNPDRIAKILLGSDRAKERDLTNISTILNFLTNKYKDANIALAAVGDARQTILKGGRDIASLMSVAESVTSGGDRVGVQHLYSEYKPDMYSMSYDNFKTFIEVLEDNGGVIEAGNTTMSEKADGMAVRFGLTPDDKFFLQGSYSGPVFNGNFKGKIKHEPTRIAFESSFNAIKRLVYKTLKNFKSTYDLNGIRVQAEWLYSPFALPREENSNLVYFVATNYEKDKLGTWSTFPIIAVTDIDGNNIDNNIAAEIKQSLVNLSNKDVKFIGLDYDAFSAIDLSKEMHNARQELNIIKSQYPDADEILNNPSRKREDTSKKKDLKNHITRVLLPHQQRMQEKIFKTLYSLKGKLGDYEGLVFKIKGNNNSLVFKVINPTFHKNKGRL